MRCSLICTLAGLVASMPPIVAAVPSSSSLSRNDGLSLDDLSGPLPAEDEDVITDVELPPPSSFHGPRFLPPPSLVNQSPPSKPLLVHRAGISLSGNANSTAEVAGGPLGVSAQGGGFATGKSKTTAGTLGYAYVGCFQETNPKILTQQETPGSMNNIMTIQVCQAFCSLWPYYGLEYNRECYCGQTPNPAAVQVAESYCNDPCLGNTSQICGGDGYLSLYHDPAVPGPNDPPVFDNSNLLGCYVESDPRVLNNELSARDDAMSLQFCSDFCASHSLPYWGLENGNECFCATALTTPNTLAPQSECNMQCTGNPAQLCGAANRVIVYLRNS